MTSACSQIRQCPDPAPAEPVVEIVHLSGGDSPVAVMTRFYSSGMIEIAPLGSSCRRQKLSRDSVESIQSILEAKTLQAELLHEEVSGQAVSGGADEEIFSLATQDVLIQKPLGQFPPTARRLILEVDRMAREAMPVFASEHLLKRPVESSP